MRGSAYLEDQSGRGRDDGRDCAREGMSVIVERWWDKKLTASLAVS